MDKRVFGPYYGTKPEQWTRDERRARFAARSRRIFRRHLTLTRTTI